MPDPTLEDRAVHKAERFLVQIWKSNHSWAHKSDLIAGARLYSSYFPEYYGVTDDLLFCEWLAVTRSFT